MTSSADQLANGKRAMLRHTLATLSYRGAATVSDAPDDFAAFRFGEGSRTPVQILAHMGDLLDWALWLARGEHKWHASEPLQWNLEAERFFRALGDLDDYLASDQPLGRDAEMIFQGPIADSIWHVGQLAMLRRLAGRPIRAENYAKADITVGSARLDHTRKPGDS